MDSKDNKEMIMKPNFVNPLNDKVKRNESSFDNNAIGDTKNIIPTISDDSLKTKNPSTEDISASNNKTLTNHLLSNFDEHSFTMANLQQNVQQQPTIPIPQQQQQQQQQQLPTVPNSNNDSQYVDPLEHSLASLESSHESKTEINTLFLEMQKHAQMGVAVAAAASNQINMSNLPQNHNTSAVLNQLIPEFNGLNGNSMNGIMSVLGMQTVDAANNVPFLSHQMKAASRMPDAAWANSLPVTSIQNIPPMLQQPPSTLETTPTQINTNFTPHKTEKMLLTPKPIEELLAAPIASDKTKLLSTPDVRVNYAFGQTFKYEQNIKNASSWSQLASVDPSHNTSSKSRIPSDTFQEFRTKAKEQQQRQKQEQEKMKMQKEQEFKRQQESLVKQGKNEEIVMTQR